jgi:hypothetical protein
VKKSFSRTAKSENLPGSSVPTVSSAIMYSEAQVPAQLNHSDIVDIHSWEHSEDIHLVVLWR